MKTKLLILFLGIIFISSCSRDNENDNLLINQPDDIVASREEPTSDGYCIQVDLMAGQHYDSGNVEVAIYGDNLLVTYSMEGDWILNASHLFVGDCSQRPSNKSGNPRIGHFPYSASHPNGTTTYTYSIPLSDLPNCLCIAAHAEVNGPTGLETGWAAGLPYGGNSWAMYFEYCLDDCGL
ncbi:MAG TPA: hypothetical protein PKH16_08910 [Aequorivita sp.]|jgi:hypothetical protein|nr:hypothetical protein [Aequorivita sp.]|tara:strand:+ start:70447 stop:70986 length:540 start_codon:yes stop_codon:yes gene_type:complete